MNVSTQFLEHRLGTRGLVDAPVELSISPQLSAIATVTEASLSGAFVETGARVALHSHIKVRPIARAGIWLNARVVRVRDKGIAIEWLNPRLEYLVILLMERDA